MNPHQTKPNASGSAGPDAATTANWKLRLARRIIQFRWPLFVFGLLCLVAAYPISQKLKFDRTVASMFAPDDPSYQAYRELRDSFGGNAVVILVYKDNELATNAGLQRNRDIADRVNQIEGVSGVLSPAQLSNAIKKFQPTSFFSNAPNLFRKDDVVAKGFDELFSGYTHSKDHSRAAVVAILEPTHPPSTVESLRRLMTSLPRDFVSESGSQFISNAAIVGEPVLIHDGFALIERDGARLAFMTVTLLSIVVLISLVDFRFVLLSALVIAWAVVLTKATMVFMGVNLSLVSTILTAIVTVIAVTAVLHLGVRFRKAQSRGLSRVESASASLSYLLLPIILTCATDAAGFAALNVSDILPIRQFGSMIAIAATAVCLAIGLFSPALLVLPGIRFPHSLNAYQYRWSSVLRRRCVRLASQTIDHPKQCLMLATVLAVVAGIGVGRAETETSFLNNFRSSSDVVAAYRQVETDFGGAGVWDVILDAPAELNDDYLNRVRRLEQELRAIEVNGERLTKVLSLADAEQIASQSPLSGVFSSSSRLSAMYLAMPEFFRALLTDSKDGRRKLRIMMRSREQLDAETKTQLIESVEETVREHVQDENWIASFASPDAIGSASKPSASGRVTGYYVIMARLINQLIADQWRCFVMSGVLVWILLWLATRSLRLATAALVPNLLPIFLVLACVGFLGSKVNMGAAMIAAVSVGLSIDGSVHFLASYLRTRRRGHGSKTSARHAAGTIGVPVFLATIALMVGFGVLASSEFIPTATFGVLVASTLALGTAVNLTLLPSLVAWIDRT
ncbi:MAG: efflux RND transporter permease subunit [Rubripirellula sp.]